MGNNYESLAGQIKEFLGALSLHRTTSPGSAGDDLEPLRLELLDFDQLKATLSSAVEALEAAHKDAADADYVKHWFALRIEAIRRGRRAMLSLPNSADGTVVDAQLSLSEHLRLYDEESTRLKRELRQPPSGRKAISTAQHNQYQQYRS